MSDDVAYVVPMTFAGVALMVQATTVMAVGSEPTSAASRAIAAYERAEQAIVRIAESVAATVGRLATEAAAPKQVQVQFGISVSMEGDVLVARGTAGATLAVTLTYDSAA